jgi:sulfate permease, SulP family
VTPMNSAPNQPLTERTTTSHDAHLTQTAAAAQSWVPESLRTLREGYTMQTFMADLIAGLTVAILALPLALAIAIGSGAEPGRGLITAFIGGFLVSALGGCRFQIGGPAAAFIVIVSGITAKHGYDGLITATFLAGVILVVAGRLRLGSYVKYVPGPVVQGFTCGIGLVIALGQVKDLFGLQGNVPAEFTHRIAALWELRYTFTPAAFVIGALTIIIILGLPRFTKRVPAILVAIVAASALAQLADVHIETVGSRFGQLFTGLPAPHLPDLSFARVQALLPSAFTIAFLIGVESLLSAVTADALADTRHNSNVEIVGQGISNIATSLFGGLPVGGVIARTSTNIAAGAKTPVAGMLHAIIVLAGAVLLSPFAGSLALPSLAGVLIAISLRLIDANAFMHFIRHAPRDDIIIMLATLVLTVVVDLNVAISVGVVMASLLFMHRMSEVTGHAISNGEDHHAIAPPGTRVVTFNGPLFFGQSALISNLLDNLGTPPPRVLVLALRGVSLIDGTAIDALDDLAKAAHAQGCRLVIAGLQGAPRVALHRSGVLRRHRVRLAPTIDGALAIHPAVKKG